MNRLANWDLLVNKTPILRSLSAFVSFHIGSGSRNPPIFEFAIGEAKKVFDWGAELGYKMDLLDVGGGFPGKKNMGPDDIEYEEVDLKQIIRRARHFWRFQTLSQNKDITRGRYMIYSFHISVSSMWWFPQFSLSFRGSGGPAPHFRAHTTNSSSHRFLCKSTSF